MRFGRQHALAGRDRAYRRSPPAAPPRSPTARMSAMPLPMPRAVIWLGEPDQKDRAAGQGEQSWSARTSCPARRTTLPHALAARVAMPQRLKQPRARSSGQACRHQACGGRFRLASATPAAAGNTIDASWSSSDALTIRHDARARRSTGGRWRRRRANRPRRGRRRCWRKMLLPDRRIDPGNGNEGPKPKDQERADGQSDAPIRQVR